MSDDVNKEQGGAEEEQDDFGSGLGNLPPLSDFDSAADESSTGELPPLDAFDSEPDSPLSGLPPITDINVDTPAVPTSGLDTPPGGRDPIETPDFDTPTSDLDTPEPQSGLGFQDFAADSDFSPETPEIGPGPDSDIDTPMFDSAFGGDSGETPMFDSAFGADLDQSDTPMFDSGIAAGGTPAPTQAMTTPMFDDTGQGGGMGGFDEGAFGAATPPIPGSGGDEEIGTPIPDFSPDTGVHAAAAPKKGGRFKVGVPSGGVATIGIYVGIGVIALILGLFARPFMPFFDDPTKADLEAKDRQIESMNIELNSLRAMPEDTKLSPEERDRLRAEIETLSADIEEQRTLQASLEDQIVIATDNLSRVNDDIDDKNSEFVVAEEELDDLKNEMAITEARHDGLLAENQRLTGIVGELEDATLRQRASKDTLLHNLDMLIIQIEEGNPLTPEKYSHGGRLEKAIALRAKVTQSKWVNPELLNEYTDLYIDELRIASARDYFFAKIPVHDDLGSRSLIWAECLMNGNWSVYYRTIDGRHIGSYENVSTTSSPEYQFREDLPSRLRGEIEDEIKAARVEDFEDKIAVLKQKQAVFNTKTGFQNRYNSL